MGQFCSPLVQIGLRPNQAISYSTFSIEMYHYIVHNGATSQEKFLEIILKFSYLMGSIKGLSPNQAIFITTLFGCSTILYIVIVTYNRNFLKGFFQYSQYSYCFSVCSIEVDYYIVVIVNCKRKFSKIFCNFSHLLIRD